MDTARNFCDFDVAMPRRRSAVSCGKARPLLHRPLSRPGFRKEGNPTGDSLMAGRRLARWSQSCSRARHSGRRTEDGMQILRRRAKLVENF